MKAAIVFLAIAEMLFSCGIIYLLLILKYVKKIQLLVASTMVSVTANE